MRFFIALDLPQESKLEIKQIQDQIVKLIPQARFTDPEKLHLTIAFIGEQLDSFKDKLVKLMIHSSQQINTFNVTPSYIDGFPHLHNASILWVGVKGDIDELYKLRHHIKDGLENLGLAVDRRRFIPHIALAKLNDFHLDKDTETTLEEIITRPFSPITVSSVKLFESIPSHGFHQHNTLAEIRLR